MISAVRRGWTGQANSSAVRSGQAYSRTPAVSGMGPAEPRSSVLEVAASMAVPEVCVGSQQRPPQRPTRYQVSVTPAFYLDRAAPLAVEILWMSL
jgi:hypothetical protein